MELAIRGALIATGRGTVRADIGLAGGRIAALGTGITAAAELDARGLLALPGVIDPHVHLEDIGGGNTPTADSFASGTATAAAGGITTILDFISPERDQDLTEAYRRRRAQAEAGSRLDFSLHCCIPAGAGDPARGMAALVREGVTSFKAFTVYEGLALSAYEIFRVLRAAAAHKALVMLHAETGSVVDGLIRGFLAEGKTDPIYHAYSRPPLCEEAAIAEALAMHAATGGELYLVHTSTGAGVRHAAIRRADGARVFVETCPQYLLLSEDKLSGPHGERYICSPPLRPRAEGERLWAALASGDVDTIGTDHCPFTAAARAGKASFADVPNGIGGLGFSLPLLFTHGVAAGRISLDRLVELMCLNPARIFGLWPHKGQIAPGADADVVLLSPSAKGKVAAADLPGDEDYSVYEGIETSARVEYTISRGEVVFDRRRGVTGAPGRGRFLARPYGERRQDL
ncbi:MAG: dihydropyrimidinase [Bacillota bacterium]